MAIDREFDYGVTPRFVDVVLKRGDELMRDAGVGAEDGELLQSGTRRHGLEVAKEAVPS